VLLILQVILVQVVVQVGPMMVVVAGVMVLVLELSVAVQQGCRLAAEMVANLSGSGAGRVGEVERVVLVVVVLRVLRVQVGVRVRVRVGRVAGSEERARICGAQAVLMRREGGRAGRTRVLRHPDTLRAVHRGGAVLVGVWRHPEGDLLLVAGQKLALLQLAERLVLLVGRRGERVAEGAPHGHLLLLLDVVVLVLVVACGRLRVVVASVVGAHRSLAGALLVEGRGVVAMEVVGGSRGRVRLRLRRTGLGGGLLCPDRTLA